MVLEPPVLALDIHYSSWRNSLPFTSLRAVTVGSGREFLEGDTRRGQAQGLLEPADPEPESAIATDRVDVNVIIVEEQVVRDVVVLWGST